MTGAGRVNQIKTARQQAGKNPPETEIPVAAPSDPLPPAEVCTNPCFAAQHCLVDLFTLPSSVTKNRLHQRRKKILQQLLCLNCVYGWGGYLEGAASLTRAEGTGGFQRRLSRTQRTGSAAASGKGKSFAADKEVAGREGREHVSCPPWIWKL